MVSNMTLKERIIDKKLIKKLVCATFAVFVVYNIIWGIGAFRIYHEIKRMTPINSEIAYDYIDSDRYCYHICFPTYLYWNGNLAISCPSANNEDRWELGDGLIIWLKPFSGEVREVGLIHYDGNAMYQIYLKDSKSARYTDQQKYVDSAKEDIKVMFDKAQGMWSLTMPYAN